MKLNKLNKVAAASLALLALGGVAHAGEQTVTSYNNFYVTYMSPADVGAAVSYAESKGINRFFMWTVDQDAPAGTSDSLISAISNPALGGNAKAEIATYFPNYASYDNQRALPGGVSYTIAGVTAADLNPKLNASNELIYAFMETQVPTTVVASGQAPVGGYFIGTPNSYGSIYFYDPWSDLAENDAFCGNSGLPTGVPVDANGYNLICAYAFDNKTGSSVYSNNASYNNYGNFEAFAALPNSVNGKTGSPILTSISIGGYGHNSTFEAIFDPAAYGVTNITAQQAIDNFVNSVVTVMTQYNIAGVDLDYENVQMTPAQSQQYLQLVTALNNALASHNKFITIAIISNPDYIAGTESNGTVGFAPGVLQQIAALSQVKAIDVMTYDFSGTFNYGGASNPGTTGFLSNIYPPNDPTVPAGYNFSVQYAVQALLDANVPASKIGVGIPAYGRALASLPDSSGNNGDLFSPLSSNVVIPAGDQDVANCDQSIGDWQNSDACAGMFSYKYIVNNIIGHGVAADDHQDDSGNIDNGTTAFGATWTVPGGGNSTLTIINNDTAVGVTVSVGGFTANYENPNGTSQVYSTSTNPSTSGIEGQSGLPISFKYWSSAGTCSGSPTLNFTQNATVTISGVNPNGGSGGVATCTVTYDP